jgi:hypothetical protein
LAPTLSGDAQGLEHLDGSLAILGHMVRIQPIPVRVEVVLTLDTGECLHVRIGITLGKIRRLVSITSRACLSRILQRQNFVAIVMDRQGAPARCLRPEATGCPGADARAVAAGNTRYSGRASGSPTCSRPVWYQCQNLYLDGQARAEEAGNECEQGTTDGLHDIDPLHWRSDYRRQAA